MVIGISSLCDNHLESVLDASRDTGILNMSTQLCLMESEQMTRINYIKDKV